LYEFEEVYSIDQPFHVHAVLREREIVQVCALASRKIVLNNVGITHKLELKEHQAIHNLEELKVANSKTQSTPALRNISFKAHQWSRTDSHVYIRKIRELNYGVYLSLISADMTLEVVGSMMGVNFPQEQIKGT
jgi:hypothetical protein